jgi:hypothetical protein
MVSEKEKERVRRELVRELNAEPRNRAELERQFGQVWDSDELRRDFQVAGFLDPFVVVRRKADGVGGSLVFQYLPRFYFYFTPIRGQD